jgi:hypothetical protein
MGVAAAIHLLMVVQADVERHRTHRAAFHQQAMALHRVALDDAEFLVGQLARLVEHFHRHQRLAQVVQQSGHAGLAGLLFVQAQFAATGRPSAHRRRRNACRCNRPPF